MNPSDPEQNIIARLEVAVAIDHTKREFQEAAVCSGVLGMLGGVALCAADVVGEHQGMLAQLSELYLNYCGSAFLLGGMVAFGAGVREYVIYRRLRQATSADF